ncbi:MAG: signal peptide peptidase SppA [Candidatus Diapherotrites archaeon]|nr:signal peptide peptidase SppA [Candidatus Diapherotrites archaeon]
MSIKKVLLVIVIALFFLLFLGILFSLLIEPSSAKSIPFLFGQVAIIEINGEIVSDKTTLINTNAFDIVDLLDRAEKDPGVAAILLEINSPGGSVVATKQIVEKIRTLKKPTVAWISDIGTSGAYYIASACDLVIADEDSITGSIGVISIVPNLSELLDKLGIRITVLKEGKYKDMGSIFSEMSDEEKTMIKSMLNQVYENFKKNVLEFRKGKIDAKKFEKIADGRLLTGKQALAYGLIDETGSREYAIKRAGELAGITNPGVKRYAIKPESFYSLFSNAGQAFGSGFKQALIQQHFTIG